MQHALLDTMARQVEQRCVERLAKARETAEVLIADARRKAAEKSAETLQHTKREVEHQAERARHLASLQVELEARSMRQAVADEVLRSVEAELARIAESSVFPPILEALLEEVMTAAPFQAEVVVNAVHAERCRSWLSAHGHGAVPVVESTALRDGVAVQDVKRSYRITNSLSSRFQKLEGEARRICLQTLFGEEVT